MPLIYVTGISGSGKSAVINELNKKSYEAYDADEGIARHYNVATDTQVKKPSQQEATAEWYMQHIYKLPRDEVEKLAIKAQSSIIFLAGSVANEDEVWGLFDKVICLTIDGDTLKRRLAERTSNYFGKAPHELATILKWHKGYEKMYKKFGAFMIDATQPIDEVISNILELLQ